MILAVGRGGSGLVGMGKISPGFAGIAEIAGIGPAGTGGSGLVAIG